jgi:molybdopterin-binding protein
MEMRNGFGSRTKKTAIGASVVLGSLGIGGAGFALLDGGNASATGTPAATTTAPNATKGHKVGRFLRRHTVESTITVKTKNGYETYNLIRGTVVAMSPTSSPTSITVNSPDGTSLTATINSSTKFHNTTDAQLAKGDKVAVLAEAGVARWVNAPKTTTSGATS